MKLVHSLFFFLLCSGVSLTKAAEATTGVTAAAATVRDVAHAVPNDVETIATDLKNICVDVVKMAKNIVCFGINITADAASCGVKLTGFFKEHPRVGISLLASVGLYYVYRDLTNPSGYTHGYWQRLVITDEHRHAVRH